MPWSRKDVWMTLRACWSRLGADGPGAAQPATTTAASRQQAVMLMLLMVISCLNA
jgi:hypothetical protein